jgi:Family of unknown function (DUF5906)
MTATIIRPTDEPNFLRPNFARMPDELKQINNWVLWLPIWNGSKWTKRPIQTSGYGASSTNPRHWSSFEEVTRAYQRAVRLGYVEVHQKDGALLRMPIGGVGFVFDGKPDEEGLVIAGVDFDHLTPGNATYSLAKERIKRLGSYLELSVSGNGMHVIVKARPLASGISHDGVEMYTSGRFFTMTGKGSDRPLVAAPDAFAALAEELRAAQGNAASGASDGDRVADRTVGWFDALAPDLKDEVVDYALDIIAANTSLLERQIDGGNNAEYYKLTTSVARSNAPHAEDIFIKYTSRAKNPDAENDLRQNFARCRSGRTSETRDVTVGTLLHIAKQSGANFDKWKQRVQGTPGLPPEERKPLRGGSYSAEEALELSNSHFLVGRTDKYVSIFRIEQDGQLVFAPNEQFKLDVANVFVRREEGSPKAAEKFWKEHSRRHERKIVFKPRGTIEPSEFNLWRGFDVDPRKGWQKQRRLLRHIWEVICRRDKAKFKYLIRWLAWAVQNPDKSPGTVIVLKSPREGTGKSTLGVAMLKIFGIHGQLVDDKDRILGRFNDWLETVSFVLAEEILWAGDLRSADKLKSVITSPTIQVERKSGPVWQLDNRLHVIMTTNHDHAVPAGIGNRRFVVYDVSEERACDKSWFDPLYRDLDDGGAGEFLYLLQKLQLGEWHPREILRTEEATEQQRMSADSISQWSKACIDADAVIGAPIGTHDLGCWLSSDRLREHYTGYCRQQSLRPAGVHALGGACNEFFGPRRRQRADDSDMGALPSSGASGSPPRRPWGYDLPDGSVWQERVDARLGIK